MNRLDFLKLIETYEEDIVKSTQEIVRIKSVEESPRDGMPFGEGPYRALQYAVDLSRNMGFKVKEFDGYAAHADLGEAEESVGILVHLDVVPEGEGWDYGPYNGEIYDGKIYGRGTVDDKGPAIASLYAMKALKESGVELNRKIRIIFGTNEESGWGCMKHYFNVEEPPTMAFTPDADFPAIYGEKGIIVFHLEKDIEIEDNDMELIDLKGGSAPNMVPDSCEIKVRPRDLKTLKQRYDVFMDRYDYPIKIDYDGDIATIRAKGVSSHGSTPEKGKNAISYLMKFLQEILSEDSSFGQFVNIYNERIGFSHFGEKIGCGLEDDVSGKLNFNPGVIKMEDGKIILTINVRYPIKSSAPKVYDGIRENLKGTGIRLVEGKSDQRPLYIPKDNFLVKKLMDVYRDETGDQNSEPITIGGGTYARAMDNAVAFGPMFPGQQDVAHQKNEYIGIEHLMKITRIYAKALYELAK